MKGLILAGGQGTRLRPLTHTRPKSMVPIANRPLIRYVIEDLRTAGITNIGVILGNHGTEAITSFLGDGSEFGVDITYIVQGNALGIAHGIACAEKFIGDDSFVAYLSDNLLRDGIKEFVTDFAASPASAGVLLQEVDDPTAFGVAEFDEDGRICRLQEKPDDPPSRKALVGVYVFTPKVFDTIPTLSPSARGELEITEVLETMLHTGDEFFHQTADGWWKDTGRPGDLIEANHLVLDRLTPTTADEETIQVAHSATISDSTHIREPVVVGPDCTIQEGVIGPYVSVGRDTTIKETQISESIVMSGSILRLDRQITESLVGQGVELFGDDVKPHRRSVIVGDGARVRL